MYIMTEKNPDKVQYLSGLSVELFFLARGATKISPFYISSGSRVFLDFSFQPVCLNGTAFIQ